MKTPFIVTLIHMKILMKVVKKHDMKFGLDSSGSGYDLIVDPVSTILTLRALYNARNYLRRWTI
jgi:hypothetical protein